MEAPTPEEMNALSEVSALEAWCLAAAIATLVAAGNAEISQAITAIADDIYKKITEGDTDNTDAPA